jgi:NAD(P)H-nitrite reductase large subunit
MKHVVIIGNGISGITAARHIRKLSNFQITVISSETDYFFSRTALMYIYMGHLKYEHTKPYEDWFWKKNNIGLLRDHVTAVQTGEKRLHLDSGKSLSYDVLILATGSRYNKSGWPGEDLEGVSGLYSYQDLQTIEKSTQNIQRGVIVGGGLIGIELAEMLHSRNIEVTFLVRESNFWNTVFPEEEASLISRHIRKQNIDLRLRTELREILPDTAGRVRGVVTSAGEEVPCQFVGLTAGVHPNIDLVRNSEINTDRGILVNDRLETNVPDVYAIGDCVQHKTPPGKRKAIEQVWYTGRMMGETVAFTICGKPTAYKPGVWFNSAKFFDIEYQTYGWVWNTLKPGEETRYWEDESGNKSLRLVYDKNTKALKGINVLGIRIRHEIAEKWIKNGTPVQQVIEELPKAHFDPEFNGPLHKILGISRQSLTV